MVALAFTSCKPVAFLNRKYTKGVFWEHKGKATETIARNKKETSKKSENPLQVLPFINTELTTAQNQICASLKPIIPVKKIARKVSSNKSINEACGDIITTRLNRDIYCKVMEISETEVKYTLCNVQNSVLRSISKSEVKYIKYQNGIFETFDEVKIYQPKTTINPHEIKEKPKGQKLAVFGYVANIFSGLIISFYAPVLGIITAFLSMSILLFIIFYNNQKLDVLKKAFIILGCIYGVAYIISFFVLIILLIYALRYFM